MQLDTLFSLWISWCMRLHLGNKEYLEHGGLESTQERDQFREAFPTTLILSSVSKFSFEFWRPFLFSLQPPNALMRSFFFFTHVAQFILSSLDLILDLFLRMIITPAAERCFVVYVCTCIHILFVYISSVWRIQNINNQPKPQI